MDAGLSQKTVQAVLPAVTTTQRISQPAVGTAAHAVAGPDGLPAVPKSACGGASCGTPCNEATDSGAESGGRGCSAGRSKRKGD
jgi:hypothetical protein